MFTCRTLLEKEKLNMPFVLFSLCLERSLWLRNVHCEKFPILRGHVMLLKTYFLNLEMNKMHPEVYIILFVAN
jgi:hypothetical protein